MSKPSERLVDFLYILGRDHLPLGTLEEIMWEHVGSSPSVYCNSYLEHYAKQLAVRLTNDATPITDWNAMYKSADSDQRYYVDPEGNKIDHPYKPVTSTDGTKR